MKNTSAATHDISKQARQVAPVVWLIGKVQAGKTSIVHALTGATHAEIGQGFAACTKTAKIFDFPQTVPLIRFLDTRGLGEAAYKPDEDIAIALASSHATIAVMRAMDPAQDEVIEVLSRIRKMHPNWPILVAQTSLHEGYAAGTDHIVPYPYTDVEMSNVTEELRRALVYQRNLLRCIPEYQSIECIAIDFTMEADGYHPNLYGLDELINGLETIAPSALSAALKDSRPSERDDLEARRLHRMIVGHASAASAADLIPVAALAAVPAVQARLLHSIASEFGVDWTGRTAAEFAGALGAGFLARYAAGFGIRQITKMIPVYGQTAGAAAAAATSFATTYALGKAAIFYLSGKQKGEVDTDGVRQAWAAALSEAFTLARLRGFDAKPDGRPV